MNLLSFLAEPGFVIPWYAIGAVGAGWIIHDLRHANTPLKPAIQWAWPIIVLFFSVIGLALYFATARAPGIARAASEDEKKRLHDEYERSMLRRVNGAVIHCVAGDGLGIMTAMVIARLLELTFWQEFWFEYAVGFAFGWFIFQYKSMRMMSDSTAMALWMAFRAEFFSMLTVMGGMGAVMTWVTPAVVGMQPKPGTAAFWGFGMLGLLLGYVMTFPMNWMLVKIGWKHGMGSKEGARPAKGGAPVRAGLGLAMALLGLAAMALPAWLTVERVRHGLEVARAGQAGDAAGAVEGERPEVLRRGLTASLQTARRQLGEGDRRTAVAALDEALRAAQVGEVAAPHGDARARLDAIRSARHALHNGDEARTLDLLAAAAGDAAGLPPADPGEVDASALRATGAAAYDGVPLLNAQGAVIGEIRRVGGGRAQVALGAAHDVWGFWDLPPRQLAWVPEDALVLGPRRRIGKSFAMLPTTGLPPLALAGRRGRP